MTFGGFSFAALWGGVAVVIALLAWWQWKKHKNR